MALASQKQLEKSLEDAQATIKQLTEQQAASQKEIRVMKKQVFEEQKQQALVSFDLSVSNRMLQAQRDFSKNLFVSNDLMRTRDQQQSQQISQMRGQSETDHGPATGLNSRQLIMRDADYHKQQYRNQQKIITSLTDKYDELLEENTEFRRR